MYCWWDHWGKWVPRPPTPPPWPPAGHNLFNMETIWKFSIQMTTSSSLVFLLCHSVQFSSVTQSCPTLWDLMNHSTPGLPVHHQLPEFTQTHVHRVSDAIQPSHPLSSPSPPAPNASQHQSLFQWVNSSHEVAKVLEFQLQHHSLQRTCQLWIFSTLPTSYIIYINLYHWHNSLPYSFFHHLNRYFWLLFFSFLNVHGFYCKE